MGYSTKYRGVLKFACDPTIKDLARLNEILGEDCREHPQWGCDPKDYLSYVDIVIAKDMSGLEWDSGTEKTSPMDKLVNVVIREMRKTMPSFALTGEMLAQGEDIEDRWICRIGEDGFAHRIENKRTGIVRCPECRHVFDVTEK